MKGASWAEGIAIVKEQLDCCVPASLFPTSGCVALQCFRGLLARSLGLNLSFRPPCAACPICVALSGLREKTEAKLYGFAEFSRVRCGCV